jgi:UDP-2,4-diacetamido-2,4,6-trideoxy-beta-L-altropyranose hydrolase
MRVVIRADAASHIGRGHVMRCLTLANALKEKGAEVCFVCRPFVGHLGKRIVAERHQLRLLPPATQVIKPEPDLVETPPHATWLGEGWETDLMQTREVLGGKYFDWLIVDHYSLDGRWESAMHKFARKIMVVDDLADRKHDCDFLLDQNLYENMKARYDGLISPKCVRLLGPKYVLLRPEFLEARNKMRYRDGSINRVLVFFGGADPSNETAKVLKAFALLDESEIVLDVVVCGDSPEKEAIKNLYETMHNINFYDDVTDMAHLMLRADLAFGGSGGSTWERMSLGLPAVVIPVALNQLQVANDVAAMGAIYYMGKPEDVTAEKIAGFLKKLLVNPCDLTSMSAKASTLIDGRGVEHVVQALIENS